MSNNNTLEIADDKLIEMMECHHKQWVTDNLNKYDHKTASEDFMVYQYHRLTHWQLDMRDAIYTAMHYYNQWELVSNKLNELQKQLDKLDESLQEDCEASFVSELFNNSSTLKDSKDER
jgi:hypothetical protein